MAEKELSDEMDDWETLDDNGELDKQIDALQKKQKSKNKNYEHDSQNIDNFSLEFGRVTILQNNEQRTQYTPTIKLLKRDPALDNTASQNSLGERKPSYKSLQQREQEYAEARKRILGTTEQHNGDDVSSTSENSPILAQRPEKNITRQPNGPDDASKGFKPRQSSSAAVNIDST